METTQDINRLIGEYLYLEERWQDNPGKFPWQELEALAAAGATAYNEGKGLSFHILALDGMDHTEFHERFLIYSLAAGFDPFTLVHIGSGTTLTAVLNHKNLAENAQHNTVSARMRELLQQKAREKFAGEATGGYRDGGELASAIALCAGSIPQDLMDELASRHLLAEH